MRRIQIFSNVLAVVLGSIGTSALAQAPEPPREQPSQDIVVTGPQPDTGLAADVERIALTCAACRRALAQLQASAQPARQRIDQNRYAMEQEVGETGSPRRFGQGPEESAAEVLRAMRARSIDSRHVVYRRENAQAAAPVRRSSALYMRNLMQHVVPILERRRQERNVAAIYASSHPLVRRHRFPDITDLVIEELDRKQGSMNLLEGIETPAPRPG
jgi:hypothetical protein